MFHDWYNKDLDMCYPVCGMVRKKDHMLLNEKSSPYISVVIYHKQNRKITSYGTGHVTIILFNIKTIRHTKYEPDFLKSTQSSPDRFLSKTKQHMCSIACGPEFKPRQDVLKAKQRELQCFIYDVKQDERRSKQPRLKKNAI